MKLLVLVLPVICGISQVIECDESQKVSSILSKNEQVPQEEKSIIGMKNDDNGSALQNNDTIVIMIDIDERSENGTRRLTGSRYAHLADYPYVASIQKHGQHWCSGAVLTERVVITSADCVIDIHDINGPIINDPLTLRVGSGHLLHGGHLVTVTEIARHPKWAILENPKHNLALLVIDKHLQFSDLMHAVELPKKSQVPPFNDAWVTSWGTTRPDGTWVTSHQQLHVYHADLLDREYCRNVTKYTGIDIDDNYICLSQKYSRAPCTRDVGAPAVSDGILWGLASWGPRRTCGTRGMPAVFEYIGAPANYDWIMKMGRELTSRARPAPAPAVGKP